MISPITNNFYPAIKITNSVNTYNPPKIPKANYITKPDTFTMSFSGKSMPSEYSDVFDYMAAEIIGGNKKYNVDGSMLSASRITPALNNLYDSGNLFLPYKFTNSKKIKWKNYIPEDVRTYSVDKINAARNVRMSQWLDFLENTNKSNDNQLSYNSTLVKKVGNNTSLKLVIWNAVSSELKENNRHIPVPFNEKALLETIEGFEEIKPKDRAVRCASPSFLEMYTHRLRDNLLMDMDLSNNEQVWIKIPSIKHDPDNRNENIKRLEILSNRNWCTRSSVDKAEDALLDGDFYIFLARKDKSRIWEPQIGMACAKGRVDQIQGPENNNFIPLNLLDEIKTYLSENNIATQSIITDEGPKATVAIMIADKLEEFDQINKKTFSKAIKDNDINNILKFLHIKNRYLPNGNLEISGYKPSYLLDHNRGISVPYSMLGVDEDKILKTVEVIDGNFILWNKNNLYSSKITTFPPKLQIVRGRIECSKEQYAKYKDDLLRVVDNDEKRIKIH
jgi:hypothetical protein